MPTRDARSRRMSTAFTLFAAAFVTPLFAPQVLAFPYRAEVGGTAIYSDAPIVPQITTVLARADRLRQASAIDGADYGRHLFLTDGGWRWRLLTLGAQPFAQSRAFSDAIMVNRSEVARDRVSIGRAIGGERSLSG